MKKPDCGSCDDTGEFYSSPADTWFCCPRCSVGHKKEAHNAAKMKVLRLAALEQAKQRVLDLEALLGK